MSDPLAGWRSTHVEGLDTSERRRQLSRVIAYLRTLEQGWDGQGGKPPSEKVLGKAFDLGMTLLVSERSFSIIPVEDGVQIEWHRDGFDVEIYISEHVPS